MPNLQQIAFDDTEFGRYKKLYKWDLGRDDSDHDLIEVKQSEESGAIRSICPFSNGTVYRVQNKWLWGCYKMMYEEKSATYGKLGVTERIVYHVTAPGHANLIARTNFDWRRKMRSRFGQGVCFATSERYGYKYASYKGATLVCGILTCGMQRGDYSTRIPSDASDTTRDSYGHVYVKYYDHEFYPYYIVYRS